MTFDLHARGPVLGQPVGVDLQNLAVLWSNRKIIVVEMNVGQRPSRTTLTQGTALQSGERTSARAADSFLSNPVLARATGAVRTGFLRGASPDSDHYDQRGQS